MSDLKLVVLDPNARARESVIEMAKTIMDMAENGELVDLSFAGASPDGGIHTGLSATDDQPRRLAAVSRLVWRCHQKLDETAEFR